jgi:hypothetical protein
MKKKLIILMSLLMISCGFKPIYNNIEKNNHPDTLIVINHNDSHNTRSVEAKYLNLLYKELNIEKDLNKENYKYKISIYLDWYQSGSLRKGSGSLSRSDIILKANYTIQNKNKEILHKGKIKTIDSIDISNSRFTVHSLENYVMENLVNYSVSDLKNEILTLTLK